ncbi:MAG: anthranilate phosphoribosyltransferase [Nitrospirota bacterium]
MIRKSIAKLIERKDLTENETERVIKEIMEGEATAAQIASFITALRMKGETAEEITGAARGMRDKAVKIRIGNPLVVDTCGTGGDGTNTFNISTTSAFVVAGAGITVAKHGNRSVSSRCGSADVLKALGVNIDITPEKVERCINDIGIGFLFAPVFHKAMRHAIGPRREIGIRTIFNILGPLTNPADASIQIIGVYSKDLTSLMAEVLMQLGCRHCYIVHGMDGMDEITITEKTKISEGKDGRVDTYFIDPKDYGLPIARKEDISGGTPDENAGIIYEVLEGKKGPKRDITLLNASLPIIACKKAGNIHEAIQIASDSIDSGMAMKKLDELKICTNKYGKD